MMFSLTYNFETGQPDATYLELLFIWAAGIVAGVGFGYGSAESSFGYDDRNVPTVVGGISFAVTIGLSVWVGPYGNWTPLLNVLLSLFSSWMAIAGLYMAIVSSSTD